MCALNRTFDFLCPNGTIFSQEVFVCVWWNQFDCSSAPGLYNKNADIYDYSQTGAPPTTGGQGSGFGGAPGQGPSGNWNTFLHPIHIFFLHFLKQCMKFLGPSFGGRPGAGPTGRES